MWGSVIIFVAASAFGWNKELNGFALVGAILILLLIGMGFAALLNVTIERVAYRRLRRAPRLAPLISAIGVSFVLQTLARVWRGSGGESFPPIFPTAEFAIGGVKISWLDIFVVALAIALMYGLDSFVRLTKLGRAMRATAQDPEAAALMGVNINQTIATTFLIGGALAGAAAVIWNLFVGQVKFNIGFEQGLIAFTAAVLGGIGNLRGAVLGGFLIGVIQALTILYVPNGVSWVDVAVFSILVLILVFRPSGLLGQQVPDKV
jgi:branched-chain amino acid transport system permease protein